LLDQVDVVHTRLPSSRTKKPGSLPAAPDGYPLRTWRSPFVTESREHQENPSREWSVGELEYGARPTFPPANVQPDAAVPPSALNESRDVHPCLRLRALPEGAIWNAGRSAKDAFDRDEPADEAAYWFACGDEDSNWGSRATARRGRILGYRHREGRETERREAKRAKAHPEEGSCHPLGPRPIARRTGPGICWHCFNAPIAVPCPECGRAATRAQRKRGTVTIGRIDKLERALQGQECSCHPLAQRPIGRGTRPRQRSVLASANPRAGAAPGGPSRPRRRRG